LPGYIGEGLGKLLLEDFLERIRNDGARTVTVHSDPNAEGFYMAFGFKTMGQKETSIKERYLPIMKLTFVNY
jgi:predicted N-acetyltransferase YhbS